MGVPTHQPRTSAGAAEPRSRGFPECHYRTAAALFALAFAVYVYTLAPGLMPGDTSDMVQAAATLREAHPPGYPLYALVGKLFVALPVGNIPYRVNLMAASLGGLSVAFVFLALVLLTRHPLASVAAALLFAFSYLFWTYSILAETFCLNNFLLALTAFLALLWRERHRQSPGSQAERQTLGVLAFLAGLSLGNHHTMVLTFPGLLGFCALADRSVVRPRRLVGLFGWFALGLVIPYAYLHLAARATPYHHWEDASTLSGLLALFLRRKYGTFQLAPGKGNMVTPLDQAETFFGTLAGHFLWAGFLLGVIGIVLATRRDRPFLVYSGAAFLFGVLFILRANIDPEPTAYHAATLERFYQLPSFFFLLWTGVAMASVGRAITSALEATTLPPVPRAALGAAALIWMPALLFVRNLPTTSLRGNYLYPRFMANILDTLPPNAILLSWTDTVGMGADYLREVEGRRRDVALVLMGIVGSEPYRTTVRRKYPHLWWPEAGPDKPFRLGPFLSTNLQRHRVFVDSLPIRVTFPLTRYGLIYEFRQRGSRPAVEEVVTTNDELWRRYDLRQVNTTLYPANSMCYSIVVFYYLWHCFGLGSEYNHFGRFAEAMKHLKACQDLDGYGYVTRSSSWHRQMALSYLGTKRPRDAIRHLRSAIRAAPEEPESYAMLSAAYRAVGDLRQARRWAEEHRRRR